MLPKTYDKYNITFEEASKDSPKFRYGVNHFMEDIDATQRWIEAVSKSGKICGDDLISNHVLIQSPV